MGGGGVRGEGWGGGEFNRRGSRLSYTLILSYMLTFATTLLSKVSRRYGRNT